MKSRFEVVTFANPAVTVLRPGTIWGGLSKGLPNRVHTVINRMLTDPDFSVAPHTEPFFTCHIGHIVGTLQWVIETGGHCYKGLVRPVADDFYPTTGEKLSKGWRPPGYSTEPVPASLRIEEPPMKLYEDYYFGDTP